MPCLLPASVFISTCSLMTPRAEHLNMLNHNNPTTYPNAKPNRENNTMNPTPTLTLLHALHMKIFKKTLIVSYRVSTCLYNQN